jgi:hypothetical protein
VQLFIDGGLAILDAIRKIDYNVWRQRPTVGKWKKASLLLRAWWQSRQMSNGADQRMPIAEEQKP